MLRRLNPRRRRVSRCARLGDARIDLDANLSVRRKREALARVFKRSSICAGERYEGVPPPQWNWLTLRFLETLPATCSISLLQRGRDRERQRFYPSVSTRCTRKTGTGFRKGRCMLERKRGAALFGAFVIISRGRRDQNRLSTRERWDSSCSAGRGDCTFSSSRRKLADLEACPVFLSYQAFNYSL